MKKQAGTARTKSFKPTIVFDDDTLIVVDKPAGVWPREGVFDEPGVYNLVAPGQAVEDIALVQINALDQDVSGLVLYARDASVADALNRQFGEDKAELVYDAVVRGPLLQDSGVIEIPKPGAARGGEADKKSNISEIPGRTEWRVADTFVGFALLECRSGPPRDDAVRQHLQLAGMPLAVDSRFGGAGRLMLSSFKAGYRKSRRRPERPLIERPSLHAKSLSFLHPVDGRSLSYESPRPKDLKALLHQLDRFGRLPK